MTFFIPISLIKLDSLGNFLVMGSPTKPARTTTISEDSAAFLT